MLRNLLVLAILAVAGGASANLFLINSPAPYLRANGESPYTPTAIDLNANGFFAGQTVLLTRLGQYNPNASPALAYGMSAVFSFTGAILSSGNLNRVTGAISAGPGWTSPNTLIGGLSTDIPEDFLVCNYSGTANGILLTIPAGAQYIFAAAVDDYYTDNNNAPEFYLSIAPVPEPTAFAALGLAALGLIRRRKATSGRA